MLNLAEKSGRWQFENAKGIRVRLDVIEPSTFATREEAVAAADRNSVTFREA